MTFDIIKLNFSGPVHLSKGKADYSSSDTVLHSDAIKSALFAAALEAGITVDVGQSTDETGGGQNTFMEDFTISSAFPFYGEEFFFPKPFSGIPGISGISNDYKVKKGIDYIGKSIFEQMIAGGQQEIRPSHLHLNGKYLSDHPDMARVEYITHPETMMRVAVPRIFSEGSEAQPYYTERVFFQDQAGLYFFIKIHNETQRNAIERAIEQLGENGIGTDRSTGNGTFKACWSKLTMKLPEIATHRILLSLYCPISGNGFNDTKTAYSVVKRGGYIASAENADVHTAYRKKSVYLISEGSVLPGTEELKGRLVNLQPDIMKSAHPVWRDGQSFSLPINPI